MGYHKVEFFAHVRLDASYVCGKPKLRRVNKLYYRVEICVLTKVFGHFYGEVLGLIY